MLALWLLCHLHWWWIRNKQWQNSQWVSVSAPHANRRLYIGILTLYCRVRLELARFWRNFGACSTPVHFDREECLHTPPWWWWCCWCCCCCCCCCCCRCCCCWCLWCLWCWWSSHRSGGSGGISERGGDGSGTTARSGWRFTNCTSPFSSCSMQCPQPDGTALTLKRHQRNMATDVGQPHIANKIGSTTNLWTWIVNLGQNASGFEWWRLKPTSWGVCMAFRPWNTLKIATPIRASKTHGHCSGAPSGPAPVLTVLMARARHGPTWAWAWLAASMASRFFAVQSVPD